MQGVLELPDNLVPLQTLVLGSLERVSTVFERELDSELPPVAEMCVHVERYRGKMLRPTLVFVAGLAASDNAAASLDAEAKGLITPAHVTVAAVCEMVHMATLVHDDVLDEAEIRRRGSTLNTLRGNEEAVILGDYLIASAYHLCSQMPTTGPARAIGRTSQVMCAGELLQLHHRNNWSLDEATYLEILEGKTGALIATACELGAQLSTDDSARSKALARFGLTLGVAFQIQDDLLDLTGDEGVVGKSVRKDLEKGKLTLPLIHHLGAASPEVRGRSLALIEAAAGRDGGEDAVGELIAAVGETGSLEASKAKARELVAQAKRSLEVLPPSPARDLLSMMADAVVDRAF
ncbi:MAG: octaprenyl-diphosphate synthase [Phycisphaerales bacterium]|jgi:octaprenyl-diphosphate synthase